MNDYLKKILQYSNFFKMLTENCDSAQKNSLFEKMQEVELKPGEILYNQGDPSEGIYILVEGLLAVEIHFNGFKKFLGTIRYGQTIGEMGAISGQPRATTIRALRHSYLLKLDNEVFTQHCLKQPKVLLNLLNMLITRQTNTLQAFEDVYQFVNVGFILANDQMDAEIFLQRFISIFSEYKKIKFFNSADYSEVSDKLVESLQLAEKENNFVFYLINYKNKQVANYFLSHVERIFVIGDGTSSPNYSKYVQNIQESMVKQELILLYSHKCKPIHTHAWLKTFNYFRLHHIALENDDDINRLVRIINGNALALVLSGGGTKGWVHAGVLKALDDANIPIDVIGGTSIGAVIGAKYLLENNYEKFYSAMTEYARLNEHPYRLLNLTFPLVSILNGKNLTQATRMLFKNEKIENLWKPYFCVSCNLSKSQQHVSTTGSLFTWTRATSSIPGIIPPMTIKGEIYVDGAISNNLPVDVMRNFFDGAGNIIAVDLSYIHDENVYRLPAVITFFDAFMIKLKSLFKKHKFPKIHDIIMRARLIGTSERIKLNGLRANILIRPDLTKYKALTEIKHTNELFEIGYNAMQERIPELLKLLNKDKQ